MVAIVFGKSNGNGPWHAVRNIDEARSQASRVHEYWVAFCGTIRVEPARGKPHTQDVCLKCCLALGLEAVGIATDGMDLRRARVELPRDAPAQ